MMNQPLGLMARITDARRTERAVDWVAVAALVLGFAALAIPLFWDWARGTFAAGTQGHEVVIVAVSVWLGFRKRHQIAQITTVGSTVGGAALFVTGLALYHFGRGYDLRFALLALVVLMAALLVYFKGRRALQVVWFALFFPVFAVPLPLDLVLTLTGPLKTSVSAVAANVLQLFGYDVGRSGVVITIGQYQLLVTEACAGLQTMFTLEAMGLLYANVMNYQSLSRNVALAVLVVPIAFTANVVRVIALALVTLHLGDAAGQGFLHAFAGLTLFAVGLALVMGVDSALGRFPQMRARTA